MFNDVNMWIYKGMRSNSKCEVFGMLANIEEIQTDDEILRYFILNLIRCINQFKKYDNICIRCTYHLTKKIQYINANKEIHQDYEEVVLNTSKVELYSIESFINELYNTFYLLFPYNTLSLETIYNNPSITYMINEYYHG